MALTSGTRLGVYEVTAQIGAGGMGEVYKAWDTRLDRTVAIKILPDNFAAEDTFARLLGADPGTLRSWESGRRRPQGEYVTRVKRP